MPIFDMDKFIMYEGLCKKCYYQRVYQEGLSPEQIDWLQPAENDDELYDIKMLSTLDNYKFKPMFAKIKEGLDRAEQSEKPEGHEMFTNFQQLQKVWLREKNKDYNER